MRNIRCLSFALALAGGAFAAGPAFARDGHDAGAIAGGSGAGQLVRPTDKDAAWLAKAKTEYPLDTCPVSGDKLKGGDMGKPLDFIYRQAGKPDRLVRFCCKDCLKDFNKDPAKYLKQIDDAAAKSKAMAAMPGMSGMAGMQDMPMK